MTILEELADEFAGIDTASLSSVDRAALELHLIDTVGAGIAGALTPDGQGLLALQSQKSTYAGLRALSDTALDDVTVRCAATRLSEVDDIHLPSGTTPGSIIVPAALVLATHQASRATNFAAAVVAGYEAMTRLGAAADGQNLVYKGVWTTYFTATFGTAALTARLLELDAVDTAHALAIALTLTSGRMGQPGSEKTARWLSAGYAARAGCFAALSAADGFRGDLSLLDGPWMENAQGVELDRDAFAKDHATDTVIPGISFKPYFSAKQMIGSIAGFETILERGIAPAEIDKIEISVPENYAKMIDHGVVAGNRLSSATSAGYQLGLAAYHHAGLYDVSRSEYVLSDEITGLMDKVSVTADAALGEYLPDRWPARVSVTAGERTETVEVIDAPGDPGTQFDRDRVVAKFHAINDPLIGAPETDEWIKLAEGAVADNAILADMGARYLKH